MKAAVYLLSALPFIVGCSEESEAPAQEIGLPVREGWYINNGEHLPPSSRYHLWGVNGCNAVVVYAEHGDSGEGVVTHYEPMEHILDNALKWNELWDENEGLQNAQQTHATIFYAAPPTAGDEEVVIAEIYFLTGSLKAIFGKDTRVRHMPYPMTPPGTGPHAPSLDIDLKQGTIDSEWYDPVGVRIDKDESFQFPKEHVTDAADKGIKESVMSSFEREQ